MAKLTFTNAPNITVTNDYAITGNAVFEKNVDINPENITVGGSVPDFSLLLNKNWVFNDDVNVEGNLTVAGYVDVTGELKWENTVTCTKGFSTNNIHVKEGLVAVGNGGGSFKYADVDGKAKVLSGDLEAMSIRIENGDLIANNFVLAKGILVANADIKVESNDFEIISGNVKITGDSDCGGDMTITGLLHAGSVQGQLTTAAGGMIIDEGNIEIADGNIEVTTGDFGLPGFLSAVNVTAGTSLTIADAALTPVLHTIDGNNFSYDSISLTDAYSPNKAAYATVTTVSATTGVVTLFSDTVADKETRSIDMTVHGFGTIGNKGYTAIINASCENNGGVYSAYGPLVTVIGDQGLSEKPTFTVDDNSGSGPFTVKCDNGTVEIKWVSETR